MLLALRATRAVWPSDTPGGTVHSACISLWFRGVALVNNPGHSVLWGSLAAPPCCVQGSEAGAPTLCPPMRPREMNVISCPHPEVSFEKPPYFSGNCHLG